ncbi:unnamed protein product, partial [Linum tenue]
LVVLAGLVAWGYQAIQPPPPKICGSSDGPLVTASRIKLRDGRHLAYREHGVSKDVAKIKVVFIHGFDSDPHPSRTVKSQVSDIEELADQLGLGSKFYLIGYSLGGQLGWGCLKYIPHRLAGVTLLTPASNYWWPGFPSNLSTEALYKHPPCDYWSLRVAHYAPWLTHWWNTQNWFPILGAISKSPHILSREDKEVVAKLIAKGVDNMEHVRQQGEYESLHRDLNVGFGNWEFDPVEMENPFTNNEVSVHLWQGDEDILVPAILQRYIAERHSSWIQYHELAGSGHFFPYLDGMADTIVKTMLNDKE